MTLPLTSLSVLPQEGTDLADVCTRASEMLILLGVAYDKVSDLAVPAYGY